MEQNIKSKTFFFALKEFHDHPQKVRKYFKDNRLTLSEKKILECWFLFRDGKNESIVEQLGKLPAQPDELVESQKNLILGLAHNNQGHFLEALALINKANTVLKKYELPYFHFIALSNLFNVYFNLKTKVGMRTTIFEMRQFKAQNQRQAIIYQIMRMNYFSFCGKHYFAGKQITLIIQKQQHMNESLSIYFVTCKFMHEVRSNQLTQANRTLNDMKKFRKFHFNSNFKFMRMMLDHLIADKPLYVYDHDFESSPMLYHQIKVIQLLEESNREEALSHWKSLQKIQPDVYTEPFQYQGDPCLFSLSLKLHDQKKSAGIPQLPTGMPKEQWLYTLLREVGRPIRKDELYRLIWNKADPDKDDFNKLKVLISRTRERYQIDIGYKKGCYQICPTVSAQKKSA